MQRFFVLLLFLLVCLVTPAAAQRNLSAELERLQRLSESLEVDADDVEYAAAERKLIARGNVRLRLGERHLSADEVAVDLDDETVTASGHILLVDGESRLEGDRLEYSYRTNRGRIEHAQALLSPGISVIGREIRRDGERQFWLHDGSFTACRLCQPAPETPDWEFRAREATIYLDEWVFSRDTSLWLKGVPVFYSPVAAIPIGPRRSGFLIPRLSYGSRDGFGIRQPFFWAISRSQDATFTTVYRSKRGFEFNAEYRYVLDERSKGELFGRYLRDQLADAPREDRAEVRWLHDQTLSRTWSFKADARYLSERTLPRDFVESSVADRTQRTNRSSAFLTQITDRYMLLGLLEAIQDLSETSQETRASRLPEARFQWLPQRLFSTPLVAEGDGSAVYLERSEASDAGRFDIRPVVHLPLSLGPWASSLTSVGLRETAYTHSDRPGGDKTRFLVEVSERFGSRLLRRFDSPGLGLTRLTHVVEPSVTYLYVPWTDQQSLPQFDRLDFISPQNHFLFRLSNRWLGTTPNPGGGVQSREVATLDVAQGVNLDPHTRPFSDVYLASLTPERVDQAVTDVRSLGNGFSEARERRLSNTVVSAGVSPWSWGTLHGTLAVDPERWNTAGTNAGFEIRIPDRLLLDVAHTYERGRVAHGLRAKAEVPLPKGFLLDLLTRYDLSTSALLEQGVGLRYRTCCWEGTLRYTYRSRGLSEKVENDVRFTIDLNVPTLGTR